MTKVIIIWMDPEQRPFTFETDHSIEDLQDVIEDSVELLYPLLTFKANNRRVINLTWDNILMLDMSDDGTEDDWDDVITTKDEESEE